MKGDSKSSSLARVYQQAGPYLSLGIEFVASILLCLFAGRWLDSKLGTEPAFLLVGVFLGAAAGFYSFFRKVMNLQEKEKKKAGQKGPEAKCEE
ncbi:MAG: AtpZ/AtpI family protein [bacterium]|nr:AtpZ/AtpI family protein [bacterium]